MRKKIVGIVTAICVMGTLFGGCGKSDSPDEKNTEITTKKEEISWEEQSGEEITTNISDRGGKQTQLIMVYMVGSNLESENGLGSMDLSEMAESNFDSDNLNVIVCTGGASKWWIEDISADECEVHEVVDKDLELKTTLQNDNMADKSTLTEFIDYGTDNYDADSYALILWDHGAGAVLGYGVDENHDNQVMSVVDLKQGILDSNYCSEGNKMEWIGFDACLMGMLEVADALSDCSEYMISSEEVIPGFGWNYAFLGDYSKAAQRDGLTAGNCILDSYKYFYENEYKYPVEYTLSCMDLSKVENAKNSWNTLVEAAISDLKTGGYSPIARDRDEALDFGKLGDTCFYDTVDMLDMANKLSAIYPDETEKIKESLNELVVSSRSNMLHTGGVAIYFPYDNMDYADVFMSYYEKLNFSDEYVKFLKEFTDIKTGASIADWNIDELQPEEDSSEENKGQYKVKLPESLIQNYARAKFSIWEDEGDGSYVMWLNSSDVNLTENGILSSKYDGKIFYIGDTEGESVPCSAVEIDRNEDYSVYAIPVVLCNLDNFEYKTAYVHFKIGVDYPEGVICGIYNTLDEDAGLYPDRTEVVIDEKTEVHPFLFAREIAYKKSGAVDSFDKWESTSGMGGGFTIKGDFAVTMKEAPKADYCCIFQVHDTQGKNSYTKPIYKKR